MCGGLVIYYVLQFLRPLHQLNIEHLQLVPFSLQLFQFLDELLQVDFLGCDVLVDALPGDARCFRVLDAASNLVVPSDLVQS